MSTAQRVPMMQQVYVDPARPIHLGAPEKIILEGADLQLVRDALEWAFAASNTPASARMTARALDRVGISVREDQP